MRPNKVARLLKVSSLESRSKTPQIPPPCSGGPDPQGMDPKIGPKIGPGRILIKPEALLHDLEYLMLKLLRNIGYQGQSGVGLGLEVDQRRAPDEAHGQALAVTNGATMQLR